MLTTGDGPGHRIDGPATIVWETDTTTLEFSVVSDNPEGLPGHPAPHSSEGQAAWLHDVVHVVCNTTGLPLEPQDMMIEITDHTLMS